MDGPVEATARAVDIALSEVLASVRLRASLISRAELSAPFRVVSRGLPRAMFHVVVKGEPRVRVGHDEVGLRAGDVVLLPQGSPHEIAVGEPIASAHIEDLRAVDDGSCVGVVAHGGGGAAVRIICGSFELRHPAGASMLGTLPPRMVAHGRPGASDVAGWLDQTIHLLSGALDRRSPEAAPVVDRLTVRGRLLPRVQAAPGRQPRAVSSQPAAGERAVVLENPGHH